MISLDLQENFDDYIEYEPRNVVDKFVTKHLAASNRNSTMFDLKKSYIILG